MAKRSILEKKWREELKRIEREFIEEVTMADPEWVKGRRLEYLKSKKREIKKGISDWLCKLATNNLIEFADISDDMKKLEKINREIDLYENPRIIEGITDEMIEIARDYPIEDLIEVKRGFAVCPFHNDKNPSAYCENNYLYCFTCNEQADSIKLYMHLHNCNFIEAVNNLQ